ncbi:MAG TPA: type II toxin-antitoxin system RelE/ParE family toxin [Syntrophales bacterium]|nr:type II toxin-antitoxin system RelE/ParE family toxin [Syntrophales bacterium]
MAFNIGYKKSVERDLKKLPKAEARRVLDQIEEELSRKADACPVLKGRFAGLRKFRIGDYRVIYAILGDDVIVLRIGHRKDVYKKEV